MLERLLILALLTVAIIAVTLAIRAWSASRVRALKTRDPLWGVLNEAPDGRPALVQFSTPSCAACHTAQTPAIKAVQKKLGEETVRVIKVDAAQQPEIAQAFGVLTVPSTVVLAAAGQIVAVNQGFTPTAELVDQLQRV